MSQAKPTEQKLKNELSNTQKDLPKTWVRYQNSLCESCIASCCTMPVEVDKDDLILLELIDENQALWPAKKIFKTLNKKGLVRHLNLKQEKYTLEQRAGQDCLFLDQNRRCTVYEKRPKVCRLFPIKMGSRLGFCPYKASSKLIQTRDYKKK